MKIVFYTNLVQYGWSPEQLETGIGGSEEKLIELAKELGKKHDVTVYMNGTHGVFDNVKYVDHREFKQWEYCDVFVSFKARHILAQSVNAGKIFHLSTEVESTFPEYFLNQIDGVLPISNYHKNRLSPKNDKIQTFYLWADFDRMKRNKVAKEEGSMLYSASFDRGLEELLVNWKTVQEKLGVKKLYITYGWDFMENLMKVNPQLRNWKSKMEGLISQDGVEMLGRLTNDDMCKMYWKAQYWCLPLNNPDSELFCINAVKAQYAGCIPVVRKIGALQETVGECINWDWVIGRPNHINDWDDNSIKKNKKHVDKFSLDKRLKAWQEITE